MNKNGSCDQKMLFAKYSKVQTIFFISTIGDHNGKIRIKSNKKLKGSISTNVHNFLQSEEADFNLENKNLEVNLMVDCKITPEVRKKLTRFSKVSLLNPGRLKLLF